MRSEAFSMARPTALRLAGFLAAAGGAALAGIGATRAWVTTGFSADELGAADVPVHGTDLWEGQVILFGAVVALLGLVAMRLTRSPGVRRALAVLMIAIGLAAAGLAVADAVRAEERFGGVEGTDRMVERLAGQLRLPEEVVREQLRETLQRELRIDVEPGLWLTAVGGLLLAAGGAASLVWAGQGRRTPDARAI